MPRSEERGIHSIHLPDTTLTGLLRSRSSRQIFSLVSIEMILLL